MAGGLEADDLEGSFQPLPFYDSMILLHEPGLLNMGDMVSVTSDKLLKTGLNVRLKITSSQMLTYLILQYLVLEAKPKKPERARKGPCVLHQRSKYPGKVVQQNQLLHRKPCVAWQTLCRRVCLKPHSCLKSGH